MNIFIAATPVFDYNMAVKAYRLRSRKGDRVLGVEDFREAENALSSPGLEFIESIGVEPFAGETPLMVDISGYLLLLGAPVTSHIPSKGLICVLERSMPINETVLGKCRRLVSEGYILALDGVPKDIGTNPLMQMISYIMLDYQGPDFSGKVKTMLPYMRRIKMVICNVPDMEAFGRIGKIPNALYSGSFYSVPITRGDTEISPLKINALNLLNEINREDFELGQIASTIERDPSLSISLLRFLNTEAAGVGRKISSIRSAVAILGQKAVRRWANITISVELAADKPSEVTRLSLIRARFAENIATAYELGIMAPGLFMAGLFSMLDVILEKPMKQAIEEIAVEQNVKMALVDKKGPMSDVLQLVLAYERADWDEAGMNMLRNNVPVEKVHDAFIDALFWYKDLLHSIDSGE